MCVVRCVAVTGRMAAVRRWCGSVCGEVGERGDWGRGAKMKTGVYRPLFRSPLITEGGRGKK